MVEYESEGIDITIRAMMTGLGGQYALARCFSDDGLPPEVCTTDQAWRTRAKTSARAWLDSGGAWFVAGVRLNSDGSVVR